MADNNMNVGTLLDQDWGFQEWKADPNAQAQPYASWAKGKGYGVPDTASVDNYLSGGGVPTFYGGTGQAAPGTATTPAVTATATPTTKAAIPQTNTGFQDTYGTGNNQTASPYGSAGTTATGTTDTNNLSSGTGGTLDWSSMGDPYSMSMSSSGVDPQYSDILNSVMGYNAAQMPMYTESMQALQGLPKKIDQWTGDLNDQYRITGEDAITQLNAVGNQRANQGIMGGTEANNMRSNALYQLVKDQNDKKAENLTNALGLKTNATMIAPELSQLPYESFAQLMGQGQTSQSMSYETDPTKLAGIIASLIQTNY